MSMFTEYLNAGATGVALAALALVYKVVTNHNAQTNLIIKDHSETSRILSANIAAHTEVIRSLKETIDKKL